MNTNIGTPDRIIRVILGLFLVAAPFVTGWVLFTSPVWVWASLFLGLVLIVTGTIRFCPAYRLFNLGTLKERSK